MREVGDSCQALGRTLGAGIDIGQDRLEMDARRLVDTGNGMVNVDDINT